MTKTIILAISAFLMMYSLFNCLFYSIGHGMGNVNKVEDKSYWRIVNHGLTKWTLILIISCLIFFLTK